MNRYHPLTRMIRDKGRFPLLLLPVAKMSNGEKRTQDRYDMIPSTKNVVGDGSLPSPHGNIVRIQGRFPTYVRRRFYPENITKPWRIGIFSIFPTTAYGARLSYGLANRSRTGTGDTHPWSLVIKKNGKESYRIQEHSSYSHIGYVRIDQILLVSYDRRHACLMRIDTIRVQEQQR